MRMLFAAVRQKQPIYLAKVHVITVLGFAAADGRSRPTECNQQCLDHSLHQRSISKDLALTVKLFHPCPLEDSQGLYHPACQFDPYGRSSFTFSLQCLTSLFSLQLLL